MNLRETISDGISIDRINKKKSTGVSDGECVIDDGIDRSMDEFD
jgi:hypothetical protein